MNIGKVVALGVVGVIAIGLSTPCHASVVNAGMMSFKVLAIPQTPEPASLGVLAIGSAVLLFTRRRR